MENMNLFLRKLLVLWMEIPQFLHAWHFTMIVGATERGKKTSLEHRLCTWTCVQDVPR